MALFQVNQGNNQQQQPVNSGGTSRTKSILRYTMMPEILPRIRALGLHFGHFAYLLALVFSSARLIPHNHPALNAANIGRFGVRQIIAMAAENITWSMKNIDQIAIFGAIVMGLIMIVIQAGLIAFAALVGFNPAEAQDIGSFFSPSDENYNQGTDVALIFLSQVFGTDIGLFDSSSVVQTVPVHSALRAILGFYSMAMMVIAVIIIIYYIMTVVGEAAKTGTPFGQRFNSLWAPIRLVVALGLLVPMGSGLNSAQYITLWMAKMGSGLATNAWSQFARGITTTGTLVSQPDAQSTTSMIQGILARETCKASYDQIEQPGEITIVQKVGNMAEPVLWNNANAMARKSAEAGMSDIHLVWTSKAPGDQISGRHRRTDYGYSCGDFTFSLSEFDVFNDGGTISVDTAGRNNHWWSDILGPGSDDRVGQIGADLRQSYLSAMKAAIDTIRPEADKIATFNISINTEAGRGDEATLTGIREAVDKASRDAYASVNGAIQASFATINGTGADSNDVAIEMISKGWGAAGIWFANIGKINQHYQENANISFPVGGDIANIDDGNTTALGRTLRSGFGLNQVQLEIEQTVELAYRSYGIEPFIVTPSDTSPGLYQEIQFSTDTYEESTGGLAYAIMWLFGASELYDLRTTPTLDPMARLMGAGSGMVDSSMIVITLAAAASAVKSVVDGATAESRVGKFAAAAPKLILDVVLSLGPLLMSLGLISLVAGAMLFYVIPLLPFVYFAFAVMGWILEIFEAIIAMPLWALAHLRIDGDGMPGQAAMQGYALIFMILLRPLLIVFGLIGGYVLFGACIYYLTSLYDLAVGVTRQDIDYGGADLGAGISNTVSSVINKASFGYIPPATQGPVGMMGLIVYTILYTFLAYNIAVMCFKMVDAVPNNILRWLGIGAQTFSDSKEDPLGGQNQALIGAYGAIQTAQGGIGSMKQAMAGRKNDRDQSTALANQREFDSAQSDKIAGALNLGQPKNAPGSGGTGAGGGSSAAAKASREGEK